MRDSNAPNIRFFHPGVQQKILLLQKIYGIIDILFRPSCPGTLLYLKVKGVVDYLRMDTMDMDENKRNMAPGILKYSLAHGDEVKPGTDCQGIWVSGPVTLENSVLGKWIASLDGGLVFSLEFDPEYFDPGMGVSLLEKWRNQGLKLVRWNCQTSPGPGFKDLLWKVAKLGLWNHVLGPGITDPAWAPTLLENPFMVHSHENGLGRSRYGELAPIPGIPLWRHFEDLGFILAQLVDYSPKQLAAMRWDPMGKSIFNLGERIEFFCCPPGNLPPGYLDGICQMVKAGGSVPLGHVRSNLQRAHRVAYALENGVIVGNSSLKHPRRAFIQYLLEITGLDFTGFVERGYTSVRPEYRALGVGKRLLADLTKDAQGYKVFSIIDEANVATQKIALRNNTLKILSYRSEKSGKQMGLWMPRSMVDQMDGTWHETLAEFNGGQRP